MDTSRKSYQVRGFSETTVLRYAVKLKGTCAGAMLAAFRPCFLGEPETNMRSLTRYDSPWAVYHSITKDEQFRDLLNVLRVYTENSLE
jgi:hypothetical protein